MNKEINEKILKDLIAVLKEGNINYTNEAVDYLIDEWQEKKGRLIEKFVASPHYIGDFRIKVPVVESRGFNQNFINCLYFIVCDCIEEKVMNDELKIEMKDVFRNLLFTGDIDKKYKCKLQVSDKLAKKLTNGTGKYKDTNMAIREGMSTLSLTIKLLKYYKVDELMGSYINNKCEFKKNYSKIEADLGDALNPKYEEKDLYISINPVDYLLMGDFINGGSCYNIFDHGCCQAGTLSYMCDRETILTFTTNELGNKRNMMINRQVWFINRDNDLLQSRLYPQTETELKNIRSDWAKSIVLEMSSMFNQEYENIFDGTKGDLEIIDGKVGYIDPLQGFGFTIFSKPGNSIDKVSSFIVAQRQYYTDEKGSFEAQGDEGETGGVFSSISYKPSICYHCESENVTLHEIDGEWYCEDCCFYCEYHEEWEVGNYTNVQNYGIVCDSALEEDCFYKCDYCYEWFYDGSYCIIVGDKMYCCESCAENDGNYEIGGEWYSEDEIITCEMCGAVHTKESAKVTEDGKYFCCGTCCGNAGYELNECGIWVKKEQEETIQKEVKENTNIKEEEMT